MIRVEHVFHDYEGMGKFAVSDISFSVESGSILGFLGPSGAGKSTIQNIMTGLLPLQRGEVLYEGKSVWELKTKFYNRIGVSFEQSNLYSSLTGLENLRYYAALFCVPTESPMELLERVGLRDDANKRVSHYSKGMRQRLTFARALLNRPSYLFLDEPTSGLDPVARDDLLTLFQELIENGDMSILFSTHITSDLEKCADYITYIENGRLIASCEKDELIESYRIVKGTAAQRAGIESRLISAKTHAFGFTGLMKTAELTAADTVAIEKPTLEEIMIYHAREENSHVESDQ